MSGGTAYIAVDLGAESGRVFLGGFDGDRLSFEEVHRFPNLPVRLPDGLHWDVLRLYRDVKDGIARAVSRAGGRVESVGIDSWAVDFGLLDRDGTLVAEPWHYRDARTEGMMERAFSRVPREEIYSTTGIQFMPINTLYQLLSMEGTAALQRAERLLMIPDLLAYWLSGTTTGERTNATTTQLFDVRRRAWAVDLMRRLGVPERIFPEVIEPGTKLGPTLGEVSEELGACLEVTAVASHDTASAVVAVPAEGSDFAYVSSGTWSLVGLELSEPVLTEDAMRANFTNEGGFGHTTRFLRNVMGLWILQECRRHWSRQGADVSYEGLMQAAELAPSLARLIDPDDPAFLPPGNMPARVRDYCARTGQSAPESPAELARCVLESLALRYRWVIERAQQLTGRCVSTVHVVGGGANNALLCRMTADATGLPVRAGPAEATALGNLLVQAHARGRVGSLEEMREVVRRSARVVAYEPGPEARDEWDEAYERQTALSAEPGNCRNADPEPHPSP